MYVGYLNYIILICMITGVLILTTDVKAYKNASLKKEQKVSRLLGWTNIVIGLLLFVADWLNNLLFW